MTTWIAPYTGTEVHPSITEIPRGASGAYAIREPGRRGRVLYVGESHTGHLRKTLLRHFQAWSGRTAGARYNGDSVVVTWRLTHADRAVALQSRWIARFKPVDNQTEEARAALMQRSFFERAAATARRVLDADVPF